MNAKISEALHVPLSAETILEAVESAQKGIERDEIFFAEHPDKDLSERMLTARDYEIAKMLYHHLEESPTDKLIGYLFTELYLILTHGIDFTVQVAITVGYLGSEDEIRKGLMKRLKVTKAVASSFPIERHTAA